MVTFTDQAERAAKDVHSSILTGAGGKTALARKHWVIEIVFHITGDEKIEEAVAIVIAPSGTGGPSAESDTGLLGYVGECAVVIVVIEAIFSVVGNVDVGPAVVVVVGDGNAKAPALVGDAGFFGDVGEGAVVIVMEEHGARRGFFAFHGGDGRAIEQINV